MKYRDLIKAIDADGWYWVSTNGSHQKPTSYEEGYSDRACAWFRSGCEDRFGKRYPEASGVIVMANYTAIFEQAADGSWGGCFPDLPVILVNGETLQEAQENARAGLELWVEDMKEQGLTIPTPAVQVLAVEVAA